jgi:Chaperone of endosialidase
MHSKYAGRAVSVVIFLPLVFLPVVLSGQTAQVVPLTNWAAPLYWQPNQAEKEIAGSTALGIRPLVTQLSTSALTFVAITPCRLVDTRGSAAGFNGISPFSGPSLAASSTTTFPVQSAAEASADTTPTPCGTIPSIAQAYSFNITAIPKTSGGIAFVTVWPSGSAQPAVSTINDGQGVILANAAIVPAGTPSGGVNVINSGPATMDLIIDMNGYYAEPTTLQVAGNIDFTGSVMYQGTQLLQIFPGANMGVGLEALDSNTSGVSNTALGSIAMFSNTTGSDNVAVGYEALHSNISDSNNTAVGYQALQSNNGGGNALHNTAVGSGALQQNTVGADNTALGYQALQSTSGNYNPSQGQNTAIGSGALQMFSAGQGNTAVGYQAMQAGGPAYQPVYNTAIGYQAMLSNTSGFDNTAVGTQALLYNTSGINNIAIGTAAATNVSGGGSNNIDIGSYGVAGDSGTIRIGDSVGAFVQTSFFAAGIYGVAPGGVGVVINSSGQLGAPSSSRRYKEDIQDMSEGSRGLMDLRPVTFRYKKAAEDGSKPLQYGLIAEEVAEVYPELVVYNKDGLPDAVQYQVLPAMLLNEVQKQYQHARQQDETIRQQNEVIGKLEARLAALEGLLSGKVSSNAAAGR